MRATEGLGNGRCSSTSLLLLPVSGRKTTPGIVNEIFDNAKLRVEFNTRSVTLDGQPIKLTSIEYGLLSSLIKNAGRVLTMRQILREVWGTENEEKANSVRVYLNHLRQKIEDNPSQPKRIINEPGIGYRFNLL